MNTCVHLWHYLSEFIWEWEILQTKIAEKIVSRIFCSITFLKIVPFMTCGKICWSHAGNGWQYNRPHAVCMPANVGNNTDTRSEYVIIAAFLGSIGYANAPRCYVYLRCLSYSRYLTKYVRWFRACVPERGYFFSSYEIHLKVSNHCSRCSCFIFWSLRKQVELNWTVVRNREIVSMATALLLWDSC